MRVLWIGKALQDAAAGNEVYDRKIIAALRRNGIAVDVVNPSRVSPARELANLARGIPYYRARYQSSVNRDLLARAARGHSMAICSWEPFDMLACSLPCPVIPILHNITSRALPSMFPTNLVAHALAANAARWERKAYAGGRFAAMVVLSRADQAYVRSIAPQAKIIHAPPGLPARGPLSADARLAAEVLIAGTFDWAVKRRDVLRLAKEWQSSGLALKVFSDPMPAEATARFKASALAQVDTSAAIRIGIVPDRFEAGHKLKVGAYIASNAFIVSFADLSAEYESIEDARYFIRHIRSAQEIGPIVGELAAADPARLRTRWLRFQSRVQEQFSWEQSAAAIAQLCRASDAQHPEIAPRFPAGRFPSISAAADPPD